jgi:hypothetical protein
VLNATHAQFAGLVATLEPFSFDDRLWQSRRA